MKAVCIIGSPKEHGNTALVVDKIIDGMSEAGIEIARFVLGSMNINFCKGCKSCYQTRKCIQRDDVDIIVDAIFASDIVLVASPSYWGDVTGHLKVLIDRFLPLCNTIDNSTPVPPGKTGVAVAIRAGNSKGENQHLVDTIEHFFGHMEIKPFDCFSIEGVLNASDFNNKTQELDQAYKLGLKIAKYVSTEFLHY
jgi:multimeric flavodoxin WrbA